jgi:hypothetical protein
LVTTCENRIIEVGNIAIISMAMEFSRQLLKEMFGSYLETTFSKVLPDIVKEAIKESDLFTRQDFIPIQEASKRYKLCRKTIYNYHNKGYVTVHSSEGKTFVSISELEAHIARNPLPRNFN